MKKIRHKVFLVILLLVGFGMSLSSQSVDVLVVAGGGGAGNFRGGGGGGGGYIYVANFQLASFTNSISVGSGGAKGTSSGGTGIHALSGTNSSFNNITSL
jgi:hypothetical protein